MSTSAARQPAEWRKLESTIGCLARADGSASFSFGLLETVASVTGPTEVRIRDELTDRASLQVTFQPLSGVAGIPCKAVASALHTLLSSVLLLHHHPRSMIQLVVQTLSSPPQPQPTTNLARRSQRPRPPLLIGPDVPPSPSEKACIINAASLALLDAGIVAKGSVAACACAILPKDEGEVLRQASGSPLTELQVREGVRQRRLARGEIEEDQEQEQDAKSAEEYDGETVILLDPTPGELEYALSTHVFAFSFSGHSATSQSGDLIAEQVFTESLGAVDLQDHRKAVALCKAACESILGFMRESMEKRVLAQRST